MVFKQDIGIGIRMGIDTAPFWASLFLSFFFGLRMFRIVFLKNQLELINTMLLVSS